MTEFKKPEPLKISCVTSDCDNDLHCFKASRKMHTTDHGKCRSCGVDLVDWSRVHGRNIGDASYTFGALKQEWIRHRFFHTPIDERAVAHARRKGRPALIAAARHRLDKALAPAQPVRDGQQTPFTGNSIYYAQHATATCCRTCLAYWHDIPKGRPLTDEELEYCTALIDLYFRERLPELKDEPEKVPPLGHAA